jgi:hypothetical protein
MSIPPPRGPVKETSADNAVRRFFALAGMRMKATNRLRRPMKRLRICPAP